jgi:hypothetical protein
MVGMNNKQLVGKRRSAKKEFQRKRSRGDEESPPNRHKIYSRYLSTLLKEQLASRRNVSHGLIDYRSDAFPPCKWVGKGARLGDLHHLWMRCGGSSFAGVGEKALYYAKAKELHLVRVQDRLWMWETGELVDDRYRHIDVKHFRNRGITSEMNSCAGCLTNLNPPLGH